MENKPVYSVEKTKLQEIPFNKSVNRPKEKPIKAWGAPFITPALRVQVSVVVELPQVGIDAFIGKMLQTVIKPAFKRSFLKVNSLVNLPDIEHKPSFSPIEEPEVIIRVLAAVFKPFTEEIILYRKRIPLSGRFQVL